jgi:hypothetical protein
VLFHLSSIFELVVLTVQTIEGATVVENGQIVVIVLRAWGNGILRVTATGTTGTDKIADTVGGQGVVVV